MEWVRIRIPMAGCALAGVAVAATWSTAPPGPAPPVESDGYAQLRPLPDRVQRGMVPTAFHEAVRQMLTNAAQAHSLDPGLVMAVAWWESGWDMTQVSDTGAVGIMQIDPSTARDLGPKLLGRPVDPHNITDNIDLGAAVLAADLKDSGGDMNIALASYYEGAGNVNPGNLDPGAQAYIAGVRALQQQFDSGQDPAAAPPSAG